MSNTVTVRLRPDDRALLEGEAQQRGLGLSTLVRTLAEDEARRLRHASIRAEGQRIVDYARASAAAAQEFTELGTPQDETW